MTGFGQFKFIADQVLGEITFKKSKVLVSNSCGVRVGVKRETFSRQGQVKAFHDLNGRQVEGFPQQVFQQTGLAFYLVRRIIDFFINQQTQLLKFLL